MLAPLVLTVLSSFKSTIEQAAIPPTYFTHEFSLDSYAKLWSYQDGLPVYLFNSAATAILAIVFSLALTIPAGYALARFPVPGREYFFVFLLLALIVPYQALITPIFFMFAQLRLTNTVVGLAIIHTAVHIPFSVYVMRNSFEAVPKELEEAAVIDGCNSWQALVRIYLPAIIGGIAITLRHLFRRKSTIRYPEQKRTFSPVWRGMHVLKRDDKGAERCTACGLCAVACPAEAITMTAAERKPGEEKLYREEKYAAIYEINMLRCIFCGLCEEACPKDAVYLSETVMPANYKRNYFVYKKEDMLITDEQVKAKRLKLQKA